MMRSRTIWDWRLRLYPLLVIPAIFYVAAQEAMTARHSVAGSDHGGLAVPASAAPLSGIHRGNAITCERRAEITFCWKLNLERR